MSQEQIQIPKGWSVEPLKDICDFFVPMRDKPQEFDGNIPWLRIDEINEKFVDGINAKFRVSEKTIKEMKLRVYPIGTVLFSCSASIGKCAITKAKLTTNQTFIGIFPKEKIFNEYLYYFLKSRIKELTNLGKGTTISYISRKKFENLNIIFPDMEKQKKLVQKLDDVLGQLEEKRTQILQTIKPENIPLLTERMKQEILKSAFSGKLTKREPNDELVEKLLERIKSNRKESNKTENHLLEEINSSDTKLPQHWKYVKIHEVCDGVVPGRYKPQKFNGNIPWITLPDITSLYVSKSKQNRNLSEEETKKVNMKIFPPKTVLMSCVGEVGRICITKCKVVPNQQLHGFISYDKIVPEYIAYALMSIIDQIRKKATKTTMPYLNKTKCNNLIICLTSIEEEERIVNKINEKFGAIDLIHNRLKKVTESYDKLNNSLNLGKSLVLDAAFSGKLVQ